MKDVLVASLQQDVGYCGPNLWACGNREQMCLRLCTGDFDKVVVAEPSRGGQDRLGNSDIVIPGEPAHDIDGGVMDRRETPAEFGQRLGFDSS